MRHFFRLFTAILVAAVVACTTGASLYHPAASPRETGYTDQQLDGLRYRVIFVAPKDAGRQRTQDLALLRAAELTQQKGHSWFRLANRTIAEVQVDAPRMVVGSTSTKGYSCGGSGGPGCSYAPSLDNIAGAQVGIGGAYRTQLVAAIEFVMGDGDKPAAGPAPVYGAKETADSLRASMAAE